MNSKLFTLLEFDKIRDRIAQFAHSPTSRLLLAALAPLPSRPEIERRLALTAEVRALGSLGISLPIDEFSDISSLIERVRPSGALLDTEDLQLFLPLLRTARSVAALVAYRSDIPLLKELATDINGFPDILDPLEQMLAPEGGLLDTASDLLLELRKEQRKLTSRIRKRLEEIVRERETAIFLQDDFVTQRNGRWVIPVRMDSKGMVPGVVHDISNTGETAFMEPLEIIGLVNELENVNADEKAEQLRILRMVAGWLREDADPLLCCFHALVRLDFVNAIACFAELLDAAAPRITDETAIDIRRGRHPLLALMQRERDRGDVVPLDLSLGGNASIGVLLITGPNTGGKTIAIKTVGLLLLMAQSGIPVPADGNSMFPAKGKLLADIGDDQSIEESLSTFSAHIRTISAILDRADARTIVLLDELGTGTDPLPGGAIACATLADLRNHGALVLATTHLTNIVTFVQQTAGMANASMEFDRASLTPSYRLIMGEPGQSHTLDIARRCGLPERVLQLAQQRADTKDAEFYSLLAELKERRQHYDDLLANIGQRERELAGKERLAAELLADIAGKERASREKALMEAKALVNAARGELNRILETARREKHRSTATDIARLEARFDEELANLGAVEPLDSTSLTPGATVFVPPLGRNATIVALDTKHGRVRVNAGNLELVVSIDCLSAPHKEAHPSKTSFGKKSPRQESSPENVLNVIGCTVDDALTTVERHLDSAILGNIREVRIIHGIGSGALRRTIRELLTRSRYVETYRPGEPFEGGDGVTVVTLKE